MLDLSEKARKRQEYLKHIEMLGDAKKLWQESEWTLNNLRTAAANKRNNPTDEILIAWYKGLKQAQLERCS